LLVVGGHYIQSTHESEDVLEFSLGDIPVLFEQVQWHHTSDTFPSNSLGDVTLFLFIETTMSSSLVSIHFSYGKLGSL